MPTATTAAPNTRSSAARHEAAHAVVAALVADRGDTFPFHADVILNVEENRAGIVRFRPSRTNRDVLMALAGLVQNTMDGEETQGEALHGAGGDIESIGDPALISQFWPTVETMLTKYRTRVTELANYLDKHGEADEIALRRSIGNLAGLMYRDLPVEAHFSHGAPDAHTTTGKSEDRPEFHLVVRAIRAIWYCFFRPYGDERGHRIFPPPRWTAVVLGALLFASSGWIVDPAIDWWIDHSGIDYVDAR